MVACSESQRPCALPYNAPHAAAAPLRTAAARLTALLPLPLARRQPIRTVVKHAVLASGASASSAWQAELDAATPAVLASWLVMGMRRILRLTYLADKGCVSGRAWSEVCCL